ncbi:MAG TPA: hypothetical protein VMU19_06925 [Bryobacteraceae bacterium]|nr:hypothetical protein [Bryobacteraceae bacterium]
MLTLNQAGGKVSGTISIRIDRGTNAPVYAGLWDCKVEGDTLSFYVWTGNDQFTKAIYRGVLSPSGDEIVFTVTRDPETGSAPAATPAGAAQSGRTGPAASQQITARRTL